MSLPVVQSAKLAKVAGVRHAFFTRNGGVSTGIYDSLNVGRGSEDDATGVTENRRRAAAWFDLPVEALTTCYQIHSATAVHAADAWGHERPQADGVVASRPGIICGALSADCAPVLIADPEARIVAACHAGWQGALNGIVASTVDQMRALGADPARMVAAVGPCIGPASYEVGLEFLERFETSLPGSGRFFAAGETADKRLFDLPAFVLSRIEAAGVADAEWVGRDTCAEEADFFSNRRAFRRGEGDYGRLLSAIALT